MFYDFLEWISYWTAAWAISAVEWLQRTTQYAGQFFFKSVTLFETWFGSISWWVSERIRYAVDFEQTLLIKLYELLMVSWEKAKKLWTDWYSRIMYLAVHWYSRISKLCTGWWEWVEEWFDGWVQFLVPLMEEHKEKILYGLTEGWPKVWWFINDRWVTLFGTIEGHIDGWQTFVDDPAQALWDWVEPKLQELTAGFLVRLW